jgi:adenylate kinase
LLPYYEGQGKLVEVDGMMAVDAVAKAVDGALQATAA